jgi:hypothetical protein
MSSGILKFPLRRPDERNTAHLGVIGRSCPGVVGSTRETRLLVRRLRRRPQQESESIRSFRSELSARKVAPLSGDDLRAIRPAYWFNHIRAPPVLRSGPGTSPRYLDEERRSCCPLMIPRATYSSACSRYRLGSSTRPSSPLPSVPGPRPGTTPWPRSWPRRTPSRPPCLTLVEGPSKDASVSRSPVGSKETRIEGVSLKCFVRG